MTDYMQQSIAGTSWRRFTDIRIVNPHASVGIPRIMISEQDAIDLGDGKIVLTPSVFRDLAVDFDPAKVINIYNPVTGLRTEDTITAGEIYGLLYSICMTLAAERDAALEPPAP